MNHSTNQHGLTLVELLATIAIMSIIVVLIFSILINGQNEYKRQSEKSRKINELTYELKVLTRDIRKATDITSDDSCMNNFKMVTSEGEDDYVYDETARTISKNGQSYLNHVESLQLSCDDAKSIIKKFDITLKHRKTEISTQVIVRREN